MRTLNPDESLFLIIDIQDKLVNMLEDKAVAENAVKIAKAAGILNIPSVITEQYPKGLGQTIDEIKNALKDAKYIEKTSFSACLEPGFNDLIKTENKRQIVISGIETHICVLQTAFDLLNSGCEIFVVESACASRKQNDKISALKRLENAGAQILSTEQVVFEWLKTAKNPKFKEVQCLIK